MIAINVAAKCNIQLKAHISTIPYLGIHCFCSYNNIIVDPTSEQFGKQFDLLCEANDTVPWFWSASATANDLFDFNSILDQIEFDNSQRFPIDKIEKISDHVYKFSVKNKLWN